MLPGVLLVWLAAAGAAGETRPRASDAFVVALDAGHGGSNLGAAGVSKGVLEKHVTLDVVRRIQQRLADDPRVRLVLCRDSDVLVPVRARVRCANEAAADLFVSVHANASPEGPSRGTQQGFEVYVLPLQAVAQEAAVAAVGATGEAEAAWASFRARSLAPRSLAAARRMQLDLGDAFGRKADRGVKQLGAALDVLQGLKMPGVLVEVGFLDHPEEGKKLASTAGREAVAGALAKSIGDLAIRELRSRSDSQPPRRTTDATTTIPVPPPAGGPPNQFRATDGPTERATPRAPRRPAPARPPATP